MIRTILLAVLLLVVMVEPTLAETAPEATIVSMPDFLNADVGDTTIREGRGWEPGDPNSTNESYQQLVSTIVQQVASENPDAVLVAGDLVKGHWGRDVDETGIFGPVSNLEERLKAVRAAGNLYYGEWRRYWWKNGLELETVYPAIGDHEIGDNPWTPGWFKYKAIRTFKDIWARNFTTEWDTGWRFDERPVGTPWEKTAYAVELPGNVLLVTLDVFTKWKDGVHTKLDQGQLDWLDSVLSESNAQWVIVQGHTPILGPVRQRSSSGLMLEKGADSKTWQLLRKHDVDLYLAGEVHHMTTLTDGSTVQVSHGALASWGHENYLLIRVYPDRLELELKEFTGGQVIDDENRLWQTSPQRGPLETVFTPGVKIVGTMTINEPEPRFENQTGYLIEGCDC